MKLEDSVTTNVTDYIRRLLKPLPYLIHHSIRDEAMGDLWELCEARAAQGNHVLAVLVFVIQFCSLVGYSFELGAEDLKRSLDRSLSFVSFLLFEAASISLVIVLCGRRTRFTVHHREALKQGHDLVVQASHSAESTAKAGQT